MTVSGSACDNRPKGQRKFDGTRLLPLLTGEGRRLVQVTPEMARKWLGEDRVGNRRRVSLPEVRAFADSMQCGGWRPDGEILLSCEGRVLNGPHGGDLVAAVLGEGRAGMTDSPRPAAIPVRSTHLGEPLTVRAVLASSLARVRQLALSGLISVIYSPLPR